MSKTTIILLSLIGGILLGIVEADRAPALVAAADVTGTLWLNGLRMTVIPLVVSLLITGIAQTVKAARAGRLAGGSVAMMMAIHVASATLAAIMIPLLFGIFPMPAEAAAALKTALGATTPPEATPPLGDFLRAMVPTNPIRAAADDAILPLILFTGIFGFAITRLPEEKRSRLTGLFEALAEAMIVMIHWVLWLAPVGVFALAFVVGAKAGAAAFGALAHYVIVLSSLGVVITLAAYLLARFGGRRSFGAFARAAVPAQAVAISTQSSIASLPAMLESVRRLGVPAAVADLVLPVSVAIHRATGPAMNLGVALYIAYWFGIELTPMQFAVGIAAGAVTTLGAVSLPGTVSFVSSIAPICLAIGVPIEPLALLLAIETFPDIFRTLGNVTTHIALTTTAAERLSE